MDKLVWQFRASTPEFYEKYQVTRAVVSPATQPLSGQPAAVPGPQSQPIAA